MNWRKARGELDIREQERAHLARLLDVRLGQSLNTLLTQVKAHQSSRIVSAAYAQQVLRTLAKMIANALTDFHALTADLTPSDLRDLGIVPAVQSLAPRIEQQYGLTVTLDMSTLPSPLPVHLPLAIYRIAQEALHNIGQHAGAARVGLSLRLEKDGLRLTVADDGRGFHPPEPLDALSFEGKRGLVEIGAWTSAVGGHVEISSVMGVGTQVRVFMPLELPKSDQASGFVGRNGDKVSLVESLTPRECDVLVGVTDGLTNKQIAVRLGISDRTVQFHLGNVLGKLGVASRTEAAVLAVQRGLVRNNAA